MEESFSRTEGARDLAQWRNTAPVDDNPAIGDDAPPAQLRV